MRIGYLVLTVPLLVCAGAGAPALQEQPAEALKELEVTEASAQASIFNSITSGSASYPSSSRIRQLPMEARTALVPVLGSLIRSYVTSDDFTARYLEYRENQKPAAPEAPTSSSEDREKYKKDLAESIRQSEENLKAIPAEYHDGIKQSIEFLREQLKSADDPDNPMFSTEMDQFKQQAAETAMAEYRQQLANWERQYPENPSEMVRLRLEQFLKLSEDVDFSATVKANEYGRLIFENPAYERKSSNWKALYRAGREPVEAARGFARKWLADLDQR